MSAASDILKLIKDSSDKLTPEGKTKLEESLAALKEALKNNDYTIIKSANSELSAVLQATNFLLNKDNMGKEGPTDSSANPKPEDIDPSIFEELLKQKPNP